MVGHTANATDNMCAYIVLGTPLPPYIQMPEPFAFVRRVNEVDKDLLSIRHIAEPEYSAFAVMQIVARLINEDIVKLRE